MTRRNASSRRQRCRPVVEALDARLLLRTIFVDASRPASSGQSWMFSMQSLQTAIGIALPGDQIRVADGVYKPTTAADRAATFSLKQGVEILGGYAGFGAPDPDARDVNLYVSTLSGDIGTAADPTDNSYHVVTASAVNTTARLDGFMITGGYAMNNTAPANSDRGGGVLVLNASPTLANCTITGNRAFRYGDGLYSGGFTTSASPVITACRFIDNGLQTWLSGSGGGGIFAEFGSPAIADCYFQGNASYNGAGALHLSRVSNTNITGSTFHDNWARYGGAAMSIDPGSTVFVTDCEFTANTTEIAGTVSNRGSSSQPTFSTFTDCTFTGNTAQSGGAFRNDTAVLNVDACNVTRNSASLEGGAIWSWLGKVSASNSRFHGNVAGGINSNGGAIVTNAFAAADRSFLVNCEFVGNRAGFGGALADRGAHGTAVHNCTFVANAATSTGGAIDATTGNAAVPTGIVNSIVWANAAPKAPQIGQTPAVTFSDVQGGFTGTGNIAADPLFVRNPAPGADTTWGTFDDDYGDLRVQIQSPVIDVGSNSGMAMNYPIDIIGAPRPFDFPGANDPGAIVDIGAYELGLTLGLLRVPAGQTLVMPPGKNTFTVEQLDVGAGATLDLGENSLVLPNATLHAIQPLLAQGCNLGDWLGTGITSSAAAADSRFALGLGETSEGSGDVLIKFTWVADVNLDGVMDFQDLSLFNGNYDSGATTGRSWLDGDRNYDGLLDFQDLSLFNGSYDPTRPSV